MKGPELHGDISKTSSARNRLDMVVHWSITWARERWKQLKSPSKEDSLNDYGTPMQQNTVWSLKRSRQLYSTDMIQCRMKKAKHRPQWQAIRYDVWCKCRGHAPAHTDHLKQETLLETAVTSGEGNWECEGWNGRKTSSSLQTLS